MVDESDLDQGWGILWDEKYAGQILMFNNSRDAFAIASKMIGQSINPTTVEEVEAAAEKLKEQKSVVQMCIRDRAAHLLKLAWAEMSVEECEKRVLQAIENGSALQKLSLIHIFLISVRTTSGFSCSANSRASCPFSASPQR